MEITITRGPVKENHLRYEDGASYKVSPNIGHRFIGLGWADNAAAGVTLSEPLDTRTLTDAQADTLHAQDKALAEARRSGGVEEPTLDVDDIHTESTTT